MSQEQLELDLKHTICLHEWIDEFPINDIMRCRLCNKKVDMYFTEPENMTNQEKFNALARTMKLL